MKEKKSKEDSKPGPKKIPIDWTKVEYLLVRRLSQEQIAAKLGISVDTLLNRFLEEKSSQYTDYSEYARKYKESGDADYRIVQYDEAIIKRKEKSLLHGYRHRLGEWDYNTNITNAEAEKNMQFAPMYMKAEYDNAILKKELEQLRQEINAIKSKTDSGLSRSDS